MNITIYSIHVYISKIECMYQVWQRYQTNSTAPLILVFSCDPVNSWNAVEFDLYASVSTKNSRNADAGVRELDELEFQFVSDRCSVMHSFLLGRFPRYAFQLCRATEGLIAHQRHRDRHSTR